MNTNFYKFICTQLIPEGNTLNIKNELIHISLNGLAYQEPEFSVDANFNIEEIELLNQISNLVDNNTFDIKAGNFKDLKILKLWYLINHKFVVNFINFSIIQIVFSDISPLLLFNMIPYIFFKFYIL